MKNLLLISVLFWTDMSELFPPAAMIVVFPQEMHLYLKTANEPGPTKSLPEDRVCLSVCGNDSFRKSKLL